MVISNNPKSGALQFAEAQGLPSLCLNVSRCGSHEAVDTAIRDAMLSHHVDVIALSGYMKRIGPKTLQAFKGHILNIHPSLLPAFGGAGMYGIHVHEAVIAAGVRESGATVHLVDEQYDTGDILAQVSVAVLDGDSPQTLQTRVAKEEGELYIRALQRFIDECQ